MAGNPYCFSEVSELQGLSQKYVEYLKTEGLISFKLYDKYRLEIDSRKKCPCPNCKGENHHLESHYSFEEKWSNLEDKKESGQKSSVPSSRQLDAESV